MTLTDHPLRYELANEMHARPFPAMVVPSTAIFIAIKREIDAAGRDRNADLEHLLLLLDRHGCDHPKPGATHYSGMIGRNFLKWEQHTEFVTYTVISNGVSDRPFDPEDMSLLPPDWLDQAPGSRFVSIIIRALPNPGDDAIKQALRSWFVPESLAVSEVLDREAIVAGDFRIDPAGHMRFALFAGAQTGQQRIGRIMQRICEIETYKAMSLLGLARARALSDRIGQMETRLTDLMVEMTGKSVPAETGLNRLLAVSAELETIASQASFRFAASAAYQTIVNQRIEVLRESRFYGWQTIGEFMMRRYDPAMRTVQSMVTRIEALTNRATRTGNLLRTRVDVARAEQNQEVLARMDRRAALQLRLQHTVEGLSVVAISYYAVSLASYLLYPLSQALGVSKGTMTAFIALPVIAAVWWMVRRIRARLD